MTFIDLFIVINDMCVNNFRQDYEIASVCLSLNEVTQEVVD